MFVNGSVFVVTLAKKLKLVTAKHIPNCTSYQLSKILNKVIKLYGIGFYYACITDGRIVQERGGQFGKVRS